jgi:flagellar biosynthetic protein FliP
VKIIKRIISIILFGLLFTGLQIGAPPRVGQEGLVYAQEVFESESTVPKRAPLVAVTIGDADKPLSVGLQIMIALTILTLAPAIFIMTTSFTRIIVVLSLLRQAMGTQQSPPNQVLISLALFLTLFVMSPVIKKVNNDALQPYLHEEITQQQALDKAEVPIRGFMLKQVREKDLSLFVNLTKMKRPKNQKDIPTHVLIPAFMISELRLAFQVGFLVFLPFLIIDIVVGSVLMSMGMMMLPPIMVSLPFKLILFVLADGWYLIVGSLVKSFA